MVPSFAFVRQPETNGVAERYKQHWQPEKNGYRSPAETKRQWMAATVTTHEAA